MCVGFISGDGEIERGKDLVQFQKQSDEQKRGMKKRKRCRWQ